MQDPKKSSSIFNFSGTQLKMLGRALWFFAPIVLVASLLEYLVADLPHDVQIKSVYLEEQQDSIKVAVFGSSQINNAVNPAFLTKNTVNLSSSAQHHNTDFKILQGLIESLPALKTVVFEVSYGHFEIPHNSRYYWKNSLFLRYYGINTFDRPASLSDKLLYVSHPGFFSELLFDYYVRDSVPYNYNRWGFDENRFEGKFLKMDFDAKKIAASFVKMNRRENKKLLAYNVEYFRDMLSFCKDRNLDVVIISPPTYSNYVAKRDKNILRRRDSVIDVLQEDYNNIRTLNTETDSDFLVTDFRNENHLNPKGAKKFTLKLNKLLEQN